MKTLDRLEHEAVQGLLGLLERAVAWRGEVKVSKVSEEECDRRGLPYGHVEKDSFAFPIIGQPKWYVGVWDEGDCVVAKVFGWRLEVHYVPAG